MQGLLKLPLDLKKIPISTYDDLRDHLLQLRGSVCHLLMLGQNHIQTGKNHG
jgi:hypothetical protein